MTKVSSRAWRADALVAALWWVGAAAIGFFIAEGGLTTSTPVDYVYSLRAHRRPRRRGAGHEPGAADLARAVD